MTLEEYFNQQEYFSESEGRLMAIDEMPFPHACHAYRKLSEVPGFYGSTLEKTFLFVLRPPAEILAFELKTNRSAGFMLLDPNEKSEVRRTQKRFYYAGKKIGKRVRTRNRGLWVVGTIPETPVALKVRGRTLANA